MRASNSKMVQVGDCLVVNPKGERTILRMTNPPSSAKPNHSIYCATNKVLRGCQLKAIFFSYIRSRLTIIDLQPSNRIFVGRRKPTVVCFPLIQGTASPPFRRREARDSQSAHGNRCFPQGVRVQSVLYIIPKRQVCTIFIATPFGLQPCRTGWLRLCKGRGSRAQHTPSEDF